MDYGESSCGLWVKCGWIRGKCCDDYTKNMQKAKNKYY